VLAGRSAAARADDSVNVFALDVAVIPVNCKYTWSTWSAFIDDIILDLIVISCAGEKSRDDFIVESKTPSINTRLFPTSFS
jgi:hypothetical protein